VHGDNVKRGSSDVGELGGESPTQRLKQKMQVSPARLESFGDNGESYNLHKFN